jgi:hypothetical protein
MKCVICLEEIINQRYDKFKNCCTHVHNMHIKCLTNFKCPICDTKLIKYSKKEIVIQRMTSLLKDVENCFLFKTKLTKVIKIFTILNQNYKIFETIKKLREVVLLKTFDLLAQISDKVKGIDSWISDDTNILKFKINHAVSEINKTINYFKKFYKNLTFEEKNKIDEFRININPKYIKIDFN